LRRRNLWQAPRRATEAQDQEVEPNIAPARQVDLAPTQRPTRDTLVEAQLDPFLRIFSLVVEENLGRVDLATEKLFRQVGTVVRTVVVGTDDDDLAIETALAQSKRRRVSRSPAADDDRALAEALDRWELSLFANEPFRSEQLRESLTALLGGADGLWAATVRGALLLGETARDRADQLERLRALSAGEPSKPSTLDVVRTGNVNLGGPDVINGDAGVDLILGGKGGDTLGGGSGDDVVFGDFAEARLVANQLDSIRTTDLTQGGADTIQGGADNDVLVGGAAGDSIDGDEGDDLIFGDAVQLQWRGGDITNPRFETLSGTQIYGTVGNAAGVDQVDGTARNYRDPSGPSVPAWTWVKSTARDSWMKWKPLKMPISTVTVKIARATRKSRRVCAANGRNSVICSLLVFGQVVPY